MRVLLAGILAVGSLTLEGADTLSRQAVPAPPIDLFFAAAAADDRTARAAMDRLAAQWRDAYTPMIIDMARQLRPAPRAGFAGAGGDLAGSATNPGEPDGGDASFPADAFAGADVPRPSRESLIRARLLSFLEKQTGKRFDPLLRGWREWMWTLPYEPHPDYARFKGMVYGAIDPRMQRFFPPDAKSLIRLDEIDWGGVTVNGIPPLYHPKVLPAAEARYLRDNHVVFGVVINGEARAYPKRILAWHEMAVDRLGGTEITIVYCTLCGTVIPYNSVAGGRQIRFGTSGLLYRSNKLMFDEQTMSLWNTIDGRPVVGPLVESGLELTSHPVVTTTWGEWRAAHPRTTVLSLDTGHKRDYAEGAAYRDYFSNDRLYFQVSQTDRRLKNKAEVLVMRVRPAAGGDAQPVAIVADYLKRTPVFHFEVAGRRLLAVTTKQGANRVYLLNQHPVAFPSQPVAGTLVDTAGRRWHVGEDQLRLADGSITLPRYVAQRAFWFGWYAQYPDTLLVGLDR
ncbi:MAG: DUF3179 domain-containing protein [Alphaproteobacteria bacterium]|nr:DUF3179 domain-containing protein [Alphaproteobacteria bacterium]